MSEENDVVVVLEGFQDPLDTVDMVIGKDDVTFINQDDEVFKKDQVSVENAISNARKIKRVMLVESNEAGMLVASLEAVSSMLAGTAEDLIIINDSRKGFNYADLPAGKMFLKELGKQVTVVDNIHEAKSLF